MPQSRPDLWQYLDYRQFLKDFYEYEKSRLSVFSYRYFANKTGTDASFLVKVLQREKHLADRHIIPLAKYLELDEKLTEYLSLLVSFNKTKRDQDAKLLFEKLMAIRPLQIHTLESTRYEFFSQWYHVALWELLSFSPFTGDFEELAVRFCPAITATKARRALEVLQRLNLIEKTSSGQWIARHGLITTGEEWQSMAIRTFQRDAIQLAEQALDSVPKEDRDISTVTLSLSKSTFDSVRERLRAMRQELLEISEHETNKENVYQFNFQVFPLTRK